MENYKLTRYLYNLVEVKQSLFIALLNKDIDESLFWAFELFYSGFYLEGVPYINDIFEKIYKNSNENLIEYVKKITDEWSDETKSENDLAIMLGSYVCTLCIRPYNLIPFVSEYLKVNCDKLLTDVESSAYVVEFQEKELEPYKTIILDNPTKVLPKACRFSLHKNVNELFDIVLPEQADIVTIFNKDWMYYAYRSPVWKSRIKKYDGVPNDEKKTIDFPNDDLYEEFTEKWYYDPDEQEPEVKHKLIGLCDKQPSIAEFCKLYNVKMKTKTRTKKKS